ADEYGVSYALETSKGQTVTADSKVIVYSGFEWRGTGTLAGRDVREVYAVSEDGQTISGRWFEAAHPEIGAEWTAVRASDAQIGTVSPAVAKVASTFRVTVLGSGLKGAVSFGPGTKSKVVASGARTVSVDVQVDAKASPGSRELVIGKLRSPDSLAV